MNKSLIILATFLAIGYTAINAQDPVVSITTKIANQGSYVTGYESEFKLIDHGTNLTWTAKNFNNNNSAWDNIRCGSKSSATVATITTDFAIASPINKVDVEVNRYKTGASNKMTSMSLLVSPNADMSESVSYDADISELPATTGTAVTISIPIAEPAADMYYQLKIEMPKVSSEGVFSVNSLAYYYITPPAAGEHTDLLDFNDTETILNAVADDATIEPGSDYSESGTNNLNGVSFLVGDVRVTLSKADGTIPPRWWEAKNITPELRLNPGNVMTFETTNPNSRLESVKFIQGNASSTYYDSLDSTVAATDLGESNLEDKQWTAPDGEDIHRLTLTFNDYCRCGAIRIVYLNNEGLTGISITTPIGESGSDTVEYFTLQGTRINVDNLTPGIYIMRRGAVTRKIAVNQ